MELDKEGFRKWLKDKPPDSVVGISSSSMNCPLAQYLRETTSMSEPVICDHHFRDMAVRCWVTYPTPSWAKEFINTLDSRGFERYVKKETALKVLNSL